MELLRHKWRPGRPDRPAVVLVPGLFSGSFIWSYCEPCFVESGYGVLVIEDALAVAPRQLASVSIIANEILKVMDRYAIDSGVLAGNSVGAQVALEIATHAPGRISHLLLSGCPGIGTEATYDLGIKKQRSITEAHAHDVARMLFTSLANIPEEEILASYRLVTDRSNASTIIRFIKGARHLEVKSQLENSGVPTLLLWGDEDRITPLDLQQAQAAGFGPGQIVMFDHCGHCPMLEQPQRFMIAALDFINR